MSRCRINDRLTQAYNNNKRENNKSGAVRELGVGAPRACINENESGMKERRLGVFVYRWSVGV